MADVLEPEKLPPKSDRQRIEKLAEQISDPVQKLKFLNQALSDYYRTKDLKIKDLKAPVATGRRLAFFLVFCGLVVIVCGLGGFLLFSQGKIQLNIADYLQTKPKQTTANRRQPPTIETAAPEPPPDTEPVIQSQETTSFPEYPDTLVWLIEKTSDSEYYSNRLRIFTDQTVDNIPRRYQRIPRGISDLPESEEPTDKVAGILFHASESDIYAFKPEMTQSIKEYSRLLIQYIRQKKAYHYFIDRFGQVYRIVREDHAAFHAGNSIWMDTDSIYLDLNHAFIAVCFEGKDFRKNHHRNGNGSSPNILPMDKSSINEAQLRSGKELTDWLRVKYRISQKNCVPHCLVSVNPYDLLIGHHLDLSYDFPFDMFGLSNKYQEPLPAITEFGFSANNYFTEIMKGRIWPGIALSEQALKTRAREQKISLRDYRRFLNNNFKRLFKWLKDKNNTQIE